MSCEQDLRDKVIERLLSVPEEESGDPLFFFFLLNEITSFSDEAVLAMERRVTTMSLKDIPGENVSTTISRLRTAIVRLSLLDKLPSEIITKLITIFQTSSVPDFNDLFRLLLLQRKASRGGMSVHSIEDDLVIATNTYRELVDNKVWSGVSGGVHLTCFKCKKDGHATKDCTVTNTNNNTRDSNKDWTRAKPLDGAS